MILGPKTKEEGVLAVWGSPSSGKTTVATKIAKYIADKKKDVILLLCDMTAPMLPCICPPSDLENEGSLGNILAAPEVSEQIIKRNMVTHKKIKNIAILGLLKGENEYSFPQYNKKQAKELIESLRQIAPYVIIDCSSYISSSILSTVALMEADSVLRLVNCDLKSIGYLSSQLPLLGQNNWDMDKQYKVLSNIKTNQAIGSMERALFSIPHSQELENQTLEGHLFQDLQLKDSREFRRELKKIVKKIE